VTPERLQQVERIFHEAESRPAAERDAFLDRACAGNAGLRAEVASLLAALDADSRFLSSETAAPLIMEMERLSPGGRIGPYEIVSLLGEGGAGQVYQAHDIRLNRTVALKVLPPYAAGDAEQRKRLLKEARAASALNHPNIVTLHDIVSEGGRDALVMEYVAGQTLQERIGRKGLPLKEALRCAVEIADALAAAHATGMVHRDIKPGNIMVTATGTVKVLDFGLAKLHIALGLQGETSTMTTKGTIAGTIAYMSPEQAEGKLVDARSDIFSFGAVLYQMLTGRQAFSGDSVASVIAAVLREEPAPLKEEIPGDVVKIVLRCLRKDPERRFQHMADVRVALLEMKEELESGLLTRPAAAPALRRPWHWLSAAAFTLALLGSGLWLIKQYNSPLAEQTLVPVTTFRGSEVNPSFSPDGRQIAFSWDGERGENNYSIYVKLLGENDALRITTGADSDTNPVWAPDGKRIAFDCVGGNGGVYTVSPLGGERKLTGLTAFPGQMSWSPDGKWLALSFGGPARGVISLLPVDGGEPRRISNPKPPGFDWAPAFAPDGRRFAYARCASGDSCDIYVVEFGPAYSPRGNPLQITHQGALIRSLAWSHDGRALIYSLSGASAAMTYLWRTTINGRQVPQRLDIAGPLADSPSASPTGNRLLFHRWIFDPDIWRYHLNGGTEPVIASSFAIDDNPQFSPDGTKIVFESGRSGDI
jgi:serine/threonine protein kinase